MSYALKVTVGPTTEPLTLAEAKAHLRVETEDDDALIGGLIVAARQFAETFTNRAFIEQTIAFSMDGFPYIINLPRPNLISVTSISYVDTDGNTQIIDPADYRVDAVTEPARITPAYGKEWPSARCVSNAVTITYKAGFGADASAVPVLIGRAMLMMVDYLYENRGDAIVGVSAQEMPVTSRTLLNPYRVIDF